MKGLARDRRRQTRFGQASPILCSKCGTGGGTMLRIDDDHYEHQDKVDCKLRQLRIKRRVK